MSLRSQTCGLSVLTTAAVSLSTHPAPARAQEVALTAPPAYTIDQWTTQDGLPQNSVNAIVQGPGGYLWLGTFGGLVRFDGTSFTLMERTDVSGGRRLDRVLSLAVGPDGALWIGTEDAGLLRRNRGAYDVYAEADGLPDDKVTSLLHASTGDLWIGTAGGVARFAEGRFESFTEVEGIPIGPVVSIVETTDGRVWVSDGDRLVAAQGDALSVMRPSWRPPREEQQRVVLQDRAGALWLSLSDRMARVSEGAIQAFDVPDGTIMVEEPGHGYWVGTTNDGLFFFHPDVSDGAPRRYALPDGRVGFRVRSAYLDDSGNVWVGTDANGLIRAKRNLFTAYTRESGLSHDVATAIYESRDGTIWVATNCGGVNAIDPVSLTVRVFNPRSPGDPEGDPCVFSLTQGPDGGVWQGSYGGGVTRLGAAPGEPSSHVEALPDSVILALFTDRDGTMWVGMNAGGLAAVRGGRVEALYTTSDGLAHNSVRAVYQARGGDMWIATLEGLSHFVGGRFTDTIADGLHVRAVHEDEDGNLWVGTYGAGLILYRDGTSTRITREDGLADDVVSSILGDGAGYLWMSGNRGIYRVRRSDLLAFADGTLGLVHSVLYGEGDGLRNAETNGGFQPAAWRDTRGRLWFPTLEGVAVVDPSALSQDERPPAVTIEEVVVDGVPRPFADTVVVSPGRPNLEFRYAGLSLSAPEHLKFRYRLEGLEPSWVQAGERRVAYYPQLRPGRYRFVAAAANRDGVWNESGAQLLLEVSPPYHSTWWFRLVVAAALTAVLWGILRRRALAARRKRAAQEEFSRRLIDSQEHERKRVASWLHDGLGQQLLVVKNRTLLALRSEGIDPAARSQLEQIDCVLTESLADVRKLAHDLTPHQLEHLGLSAALEAMVESVAEAAEITIDTDIEVIDGLLPAEGEINLYRVVQEALNNMVRHSGARRGGVRIRSEDGAIRLTIIDDGEGFAVRGDGERLAERSFGLSGMEERVRIIGGRMKVRSAPGQGTRIFASVPVDGGYASAAPRVTTREGAP